MKKDLSKNDAEKKRTSARVTKKELLKDIPPVVISSLHDLKSYYIENEADVACFTGGIKPDVSWIDKADDAPQAVLLSEGLMCAVKNHCDSLPNVFFERFGTDEKVSKRLSVIFYRLTCELIDQARKQASSNHLFVQVMAENDFVSVTMHVDGSGFDPEAVAIGKELGNIAAVVIACKGKMTVHSSLKSTEITIEIEQ